MQISLNFKTSCCNLKIRGLCILLNKYVNFNKTKRDRKWEYNSLLERRTMCFSSYKNCELKIRLWWVASCERKKITFFEMFIFSDWNCYNIYFLFQFVVYSINSDNIYTFTYQKTLLDKLFCLLLKSSKALSVSSIKRNHFNDSKWLLWSCEVR